MSAFQRLLEVHESLAVLLLLQKQPAPIVEDRREPGIEFQGTGIIVKGSLAILQPRVCQGAVVIGRRTGLDGQCGPKCGNRIGKPLLTIGTKPIREVCPESLWVESQAFFEMMGRIGDVVRERSGLAYYAYSSLSAGLGPGSWEVSAGVNPQNLRKASDLIQDELKRFIQEGVTAEELADTKANFTGRLPLSLDSNGGVGNALLNIERHQLGLDYYHRYRDLVNDVTAEEVLAQAGGAITHLVVGVGTGGTLTGTGRFRWQNRWAHPACAPKACTCSPAVWARSRSRLRST